MLTHEKASVQEMEPYVASIFAPLRPLMMFGRSAGLEPSCRKDHAVYHGWLDRLLFVFA